MRQASQLTPLATKRTRQGEERGRTAGHDHEAGAGRLEDAVRPDELEEGVDALRLARHLDNDALVADVDELAAKLLGEEAQAAQVRVLHAQRLRRRQTLRLLVDVDARVDLARRAVRVVDVLLDGRALLGALGRGEDVGALVGELVLEVLGPEDRDLGEEELALDRAGAGVVEDGPDGDLQAGEGGSAGAGSERGRGEGGGRTRSSSCRLACSMTPSWPRRTMHMRDRSSISVAHTTSESMLKPRAARMPDTRDRTPGSFWTRQLRVWRVKGWREGGGAACGHAGRQRTAPWRREREMSEDEEERGDSLL